MVAWSGLLRSTGLSMLRGIGGISKNVPKPAISQQVRGSHDRTMVLVGSSWQWEKAKDIMHMYFFVGMVPLVTFCTLIHIFVGPAELTPIPEGYEPKHWEYYQQPISRFIARYIWNSPQMEYEKFLDFTLAEQEAIALRFLEDKIKDLMYERKDYNMHYYIPYYEGDVIRRMHRSMHDTYEKATGN